MQTKSENHEWLTLADAARLAGRSYAWAHDRAATGVFDRRQGTGRRIWVSKNSVDATIARETRTRAPASRKARKAGAQRGHLRLAVDNTK